MLTSYLPFMVFPLYSALERFDFTLLEAAQDLGATYWRSLLRVVLPSIRPAIKSGVTLVAIPALGEFAIPDLLGGAKVMLLGNLISEQFLKARDWPFGSAIAVVLILILAFGLFALNIRRESAQ
jgi:spermidine/putrescine transport system permease protein